eukprot:11039662-Alexandrium_andersonii.AAC.1
MVAAGSANEPGVKALLEARASPQVRRGWTLRLSQASARGSAGAAAAFGEAFPGSSPVGALDAFLSP